MMINDKRLTCIRICGVFYLISFGCYADDVPITSGYLVSQSDFGGTGLLQMPSARMAGEGEFHLNGFFVDEYYRYSASIQLFTWLESTIRYTDVTTRLYSSDSSFSNDQSYKDKGIDAKVRLLQESYWLPETSVGIRDFGGTGLFDGEFIMGSKRFGSVDVSLGIGWGYLATRGGISNPLCSLDSSYCDRNEGVTDGVGEVEFSRLFTGDATIIGGIEYQTPFAPLSLKLEYDGNDYADDYAGTLAQETPFNIGMVYRLGEWGDLHFGYERGNQLSVGFSFKTNFNVYNPSWNDVPEPVYKARALADDATDWPGVAAELASSAGYSSPAVYQTGSTVTLVAQQSKYRNRDEALSRASAILASAIPSDVSELRIVERGSGVALAQSSVDLSQFERFARAEGVNIAFEDALSHESPSMDADLPSDERELIYEHREPYAYGISPGLIQSFGGSESFYLYSVGLYGNASAWLAKHLQATASVYLNLYDNYDEFNYIIPPDGTDTLRVRTLVRDYLDETLRLTNLQLTWLERLDDNLYGQMYGGYLESMFGGVGGELLYRPFNRYWAVGADLNWVKQRDPNSAFGFFSQESQYSEVDDAYYRVAVSQVVGNMALYYQPQWSFFQNSLIKVSVGQYLAGDKGLTLDFSKQFNSGVIVGAYATKTDMSSDEYGEGSYTKGFYISIPFDVVTVKPSTSRAMVSWQPLTRDGGQQLSRKSKLYEVTDARSPWLGG
jgi:hypothetical protein